MRTVTVRSVASSTTYKGLILEAEKKLSDFFEIDLEDVKDKLSYEITVYENSNDAGSLPIFSGEVTARLRSTND